jgi:hypothetical protein
MDKSVTHIMKLGEALAGGTYQRLGMTVSVAARARSSILPTDQSPGNHWVTIIMDIGITSILYGDSYKLQPQGELKDVLAWWLQHHRDKIFHWDLLPCSSQTDCFSCPILSSNSMVHALLPMLFPLIQEDSGSMIAVWVDMLIWIAGFWQRNDLVGLYCL